MTGLNLFRVGGCAVYATAEGYRNQTVIKNFWKLVEKYKVTYFSAVPTLLATLLNTPIADADISSLKYVVCGAAPLSPGLFKQFLETTGVELIEGYGLTEGTCSSCLNPMDGEKRIGSIGLPMPYQKLRTVIMDDEGQIIRDCGVDEVGELLIQGPNVFSGYKQQENNTILNDGWLVTGDLARMDSEGYVWLTARAKDLIIRGGHNIDQAIIENCLTAHPDVAVVAAIGQPDSYAGELPCAYVTLQPGASISEHELIEYARHHIGERAAVPVHLDILSTMPVTAVGKIFKPKLRMLAIQRVLEEAFKEHHLEVSFTVNNHKEAGLIVVMHSVSDKAKTLSILEQYLINFQFDSHQ